MAGRLQGKKALATAAGQGIGRAAVEAFGRKPAIDDPGDGLMVEMMRACLGEPVREEYAPMMREDLGLTSRDVRWRSGVPPDQLDFVRFPLGNMPKDDVRRLATEGGLIVADKPDSQDICFVPDGDYASLVKKLRPETAAPGDIVHVDGRVLGQHPGVVHYTIGQRRGLDVGGQVEPIYVVRLEPNERRVIVGPRAALAVGAAQIGEVNWLGEDQVRIEAKVRSLARPVPATLENGMVRFDHPEYGVAPGQSAVFYDGERVLGGGTIMATQAALLARAA